MRRMIFLAVVLTLAFVLYDTVDYNGIHSSIDLKHYRHMAEAAPGFEQTEDAPFVYRPLPPWIAGVLGRFVGGDVHGFFLANTVMILIGAIALTLYLERNGISQPTAISLASIAILSPSVFGGTVFNPFQLTDSMGITLLILGLIALDAEAWLMFGLCVLLGSLTREIVLLLIPVALLRGNLALALASIPAIIAAFTIRQWAVIPNEGWTLWGNFAIYINKVISPEFWYRILLNTFVPISLIPLASPATAWHTMKRHYPVVFLSVGILLATFIGADVERLFGPAFPAMALVVGSVLDKSRSKSLLIILIIVFSLTPLFHPTYARFDFATREIAYMISLAATIILAVITFFTYRGDDFNSSLSKQ